MKGPIEVFYGEGRGKSAAAVGLCIRGASHGRQAIIVRFLKGKDSEQLDYLKRLEPEIQFFTFEKQNKLYSEQTEEEKLKTKNNISISLNYAKKVIDLCQCDILVLDEVLELVRLGLLEEEALIELIQRKDEDMQMILTGKVLPESLAAHVDHIYRIDDIK